MGDMKLAKEVENRMELEKQFQKDLDGNVRDLIENIENTKASLFTKLDDDHKSLQDTIEKEKDGLLKDLDKLTVEMKGNSDDIRKELEQERNERKQDKLDTYSDFEQICRNI